MDKTPRPETSYLLKLRDLVQHLSSTLLMFEMNMNKKRYEVCHSDLGSALMDSIEIKDLLHDLRHAVILLQNSTPS